MTRIPMQYDDDDEGGNAEVDEATVLRSRSTAVRERAVARQNPRKLGLYDWGTRMAHNMLTGSSSNSAAPADERLPKAQSRFGKSSSTAAQKSSGTGRKKIKKEQTLTEAKKNSQATTKSTTTTTKKKKVAPK